MTWPLIRAIVILPGTVLVFVPAIILWSTRQTDYAASPANLIEVRFWLALGLAALGIWFAGWTVTLFRVQGDGTPAPWDPPKKLVLRGPYRHVRNPMITSVIAMLSAEALFFGSWPIAAWLAIFITTNGIYLPLSEEKDLERRFGEDYRRYKTNVPRWWPRLKPWVDS